MEINDSFQQLSSVVVTLSCLHISMKYPIEPNISISHHQLGERRLSIEYHISSTTASCSEVPYIHSSNLGNIDGYI